MSLYCRSVLHVIRRRRDNTQTTPRVFFAVRSHFWADSSDSLGDDVEQVIERELANKNIGRLGGSHEEISMK